MSRRGRNGRNGNQEQRKPIDPDEIEIMHKYGFSPTARIIYLIPGEDDGNNTGINSNMIYNVRVALDTLERQLDKPINFVMQSLSGEIDLITSLYDMIAGSSCPTTVTAYGRVEKGAPFVMQAFEKRFMSENAKLVIPGAKGPMSDDTISEDLSTSIDKYDMNIVLRGSDYSLDEWRKHREARIFSASEALEYGLIDGVIGPEGLDRLIDGMRLRTTA